MSPARPFQVRRVVVKVGTSIVTRGDGRLALGRLGALVEELHALHQHAEVVLVTSGSIGPGAARLGYDAVPSEVVDRQACAAAGQGALIATYDALFRQLDLAAAQVLLTEDDFLHRRRYLNLRATLERLVARGAVPVVNENDTVAVRELRFGDNDNLAALTAVQLGADALFLFTDVDYLYTANPRTDPDARALRLVADLASLRENFDVVEWPGEELVAIERLEHARAAKESEAGMSAVKSIMFVVRVSSQSDVAQMGVRKAGGR